MAAFERTADQIQQDIEQARVALAEVVDRLAERSAPREVANRLKVAVRLKLESPQGRAAISAAGGVLALLVLRRIRNSH